MSEPRTYGDLKQMLRDTPPGDWPSRVNPALTHTQAVNILSAALENTPDDWRLNVTTHGARIMGHVLKECRARETV